MMNSTFQNELQLVIEKYPGFHIKNRGGVNFLKGILDIPDTSGIIIGSFSIEIYLTEKFPKRFPKLYEVGGDIPVNANWHKYNDNSCCFTVEQDEILKCKDGITLIYFIDQIVKPYFSNQIYKKTTGSYLNEYPHGNEGVRLFYTELFQNIDIEFWYKCCRLAFEDSRTRRNDKCYCQSGMKYKKCHKLVEEKLQIIGEKKVMNDILMIKS